MTEQSFDLIVIGSGPAGQKGAICAAKMRKKVAVVERKRTIGGVFVLQNMRLWESLSGCTCWPV